MEVKNLTEFFNEFKKYRETKKDITKDEENFYDYVMLGTSQDLVNEHPGYSDLNSISLCLGKQESLKSRTFINIDILPLKNNKTDEKFLVENAWIEREENVLKILKDIWTTGKIKDTYGLDLNWPNSEQSKTLNLPIEDTNSKPKQENKNINEQPSQANNKIYWIIGGLVLISLLGLVWFIFRNYKSKKNN